LDSGTFKLSSAVHGSDNTLHNKRVLLLCIHISVDAKPAPPAMLQTAAVHEHPIYALTGAGLVVNNCSSNAVPNQCYSLYCSHLLHVLCYGIVRW
jgi:hypothetical protein